MEQLDYDTIATIEKEDKEDDPESGGDDGRESKVYCLTWFTVVVLAKQYRNCDTLAYPCHCHSLLSFTRF